MGEFSLHCLKRGARVIAVEADRTVFSVLERNLAAHERATALNMAIAAEDGSMTFYSSVEGADSSLVRPEIVDEEYEIRAVTLATLFAEQGIDHVDLLKCDAEGAEPEVVRGAMGVIDRIHRIAIDCGAERGGEATDGIVAPMLEEAGFDVRIGDAHPTRRVVWATNRNFRANGSNA
ncbi:MAG: FkbM family methyltransferase [Geminicoccaceae bacterium]